MIRENLTNVLTTIKEAEEKSRFHQTVTLVAVSKTHPVSDILEAYDAGVRDLAKIKFRN